MNKKSIVPIVSVPILGRLALFAYRGYRVSPYLVAKLISVARWMIRSNETTNFTYDLTELNIRQLAVFLAHITGLSEETFAGYFRELEGDETLRAHIANATRRHARGAIADPTQHYGKRVGWYALTRALRPRVIIETGVDKGLGSCILTSALLRNGEEGHPGRYFGTDINPDAGYLLSGRYAECGEILFGDSVESLRGFDGKIDLMINDSDHSATYEAREYDVAESKLSRDSVIVGDNAHATDSLMNFARRTGRDFLFFAESPKDHWYPGGGIGIAFFRDRHLGRIPQQEAVLG